MAESIHRKCPINVMEWGRPQRTSSVVPTIAVTAGSTEILPGSPARVLAQSTAPSIGEESILPAYATVVAEVISDIPEPQLVVVEKITEPSAKSRNIVRLEIPEPEILELSRQIPEPLSSAEDT